MPKVELKSEKQRRINPATIGFVLILIAASALRLIGIDRLELWLDECGAVLIACSPKGVIGELRTDTHPPLYFALLRLWAGMFGVHETAVRTLSLVFGILQLAALYALMRTLTGKQRPSLWAVALAAAAPLHVYYCQEARSYTLLWLLATCSAWTFLRAFLSGRPLDWILHGAVVLAGLYTHDLMATVLPAFVLFAAFHAIRAGSFKCLVAVALTYVGVAILYVPWLMIAMHQPKGLGLDWVTALWSGIPPELALLRSLEALGPAGALPGYLNTVSPRLGVRIASNAWLLLLLVVLIGSLKRNHDSGAENTLRLSIRQQFVFLLLITIFPLIIPYTVSFIMKPVYVVGRYDTLALAGFVGLLGLATDELQWRLRQSFRDRAIVELAPALIVIGLAVAAHAPRFKPALPGLDHLPQTARGLLLKQDSSPEDSVVCMGQEGAKIGHRLLLHGLKLRLYTFPTDTKEHLGWFRPAEVASRGEAVLQKDAVSLIKEIRTQTPRDKRARIWVFMDPYSGRDGVQNDYRVISDQFWKATSSIPADDWTHTYALPGPEKLGIRLLLEK